MFARAWWGCGEALVTVGVVVLLLVVHQLWWTNHQARAGAQRHVQLLQREWEGEGEREGTGEGSGEGGRDSAAGASPSPSAAARSHPPTGDARAGTAPPRTAYALLRVPSLRLTVPVAHGTSRRTVLDKGFAGHYPGTAEPGRPGNFAVAGHRNSHGEPFRRLDRLREGDEVLVETRDAVHTYVVDTVLPRTSPRDVGVIAPVPRSLVHPAYGYERPGRYLTLTTCTPEYRATHRLIVWGVLARSRAR